MGQTPLGETRTRVRADHAVIATDSYVESTHTHWDGTSVVVLISPSMAAGNAASATRGPGFAQYLALIDDDSSTTCAPPGVQRCIYVLDGKCTLDGRTLSVGAFAYLPADSNYELRGAGRGRLLIFEKRYVPLDGVQPPEKIVGNVSELAAEPFMGDEDARLACLLPSDPAFDMAVNVFTYQSGAVLPFVETHIMEHGLYMTAGQGVYRLSESWYPVAKGDSIWMASYCPQWFVAMGKEPAQYVYYKDVNRFHLPNVIIQMKLKVDIDRVVGELLKLASFSACPDPPPAVTRVVFTEQDIAARDYLRSLYEEAGLAVRVDAVGNTFARWVGGQPELPAIGTGSHTDAIPFSGMYDGTVGVLGGLEAIRTLQSAGFQPTSSIELVMFTSEEPTRFGVGCTGSRVMAGLIDDEGLEKLVDENGDSYNTVRRRAGFDGEVSDAILGQDEYEAWIELHIEQGPELEKRGLPIGIVTAIAAPATMVVQVHGQGGHAGAVLMPNRHDALVAAAEMVQVIERVVLDCPSADIVGTVGELNVHPGAVNSIPSRVRFTIDLRDVSLADRDVVKSKIESELQSIGDKRGVRVECQTLNADPPATASGNLIAAAEKACIDSQLDYQRMVSRAYHDSLFMAQVAPFTMLFIPCRDGVSHRPDEYSSPQQIGRGIEVLARTLASLSAQGK